MDGFEIEAKFEPAGDQPAAIRSLVSGFQSGKRQRVLLGVTGSGKTFTMAHVIAQLGKSALIIAPNKTLAAQLFIEFKALFPRNHVGFFISYYDYYQPEAYVPSTDTYIEKDSSINEDIDKMRHESTRFLFEEKHSIVVASVSCIYGLGSPDAYARHVVKLTLGQELSRDQFLTALIDIQYERNDVQLERGCFRVRGDVVDVLPAHQTDEAIRVEFFGDNIERITIIDALTGELLRPVADIALYPNSHYVADRKDIRSISQEILTDLGVRLRELKAMNKLIEFQRLEQRTLRDVETFEHLGFCPGIENYSRYLTGKKAGEPPPCLLDYFPEDFITIVDESHITMPQIRGMYRGDRARKEILVQFGFRLPSALDNRPLNFDEFMQRTRQILYVSATPGPFEIEQTDGEVSEQIIRPTGLLDPPILVHPVHEQVDHLLGEIKRVVATQGRILVSTLTKKMAEDLTQFYREAGVRVKYLHADIQTLERAHLLRSLRMGEYDVLIGINLLREGLDLPEVKLVAVMDADKEGFLRSHTSLIQIVGRAARNHEARVIFYADKVTDSMRTAMTETSRRRERQEQYNIEHGIQPRTVIKAIPEDLRIIYGLIGKDETGIAAATPSDDPIARLEHFGCKDAKDLTQLIKSRAKMMKKHAARLDFEKAAQLRDEIKELQGLLLLFADSPQGVS